MRKLTWRLSNLPFVITIPSYNYNVTLSLQPQTVREPQILSTMRIASSKGAKT